MPDPDNRIHAPLMPVTVCFVTGIVAYAYQLGIWVGIAAAALAIASLFVNRYFTTLALCVLLGVCDAYVGIRLAPPTGLAGKSYMCRGEISEIRESDATQELVVRLSAVGPTADSLQDIATTDIQVTVPGFDRQFAVGDVMTFAATLEKVSAITDLPDEIDPAMFLAKKHIHIESFVTDDDILHIDHPWSLKSWAAHAKSELAVAIDESQLSPQAKEFLKASLIGDTTYLGEDMRERFNSAGTAHILALSGLHVGIIALMVSVALWPLYICGYSKLRWVMVIAAIWLFALVTGLSASVVRAAIMSTLFVVGRLLQRNASTVNTLCFAALVILLLKPDAIFDAGFQLSFAAVLSILIFAHRLNPMSPRRRIAYSIASYISVSICAMLGTGLLSAIYFHSFPMYFLLGNVFASILLPFILGGGMMIMAGALLGFDCNWICVAVSRLCDMLLGFTDLITGLKGARIDSIYLEAWTVVPLIIAAIALKRLLDKPNAVRATIFTGSFAALFTSIIVQSSKPIETRLYLSRDKRHTEVIIPTKERGLLLVTTLPAEPNTVGERANFRYADYMLRRGIDSITLDTTNRDADRLITIGHTTIALMSGKKHEIENQKVDYTILCRGFRADIAEMAGRYNPDTIILSSDLHPKRALRYMNEAATLGIPCIWTRKQRWSTGYDSSSKPLVK